MQTGPLHGQSMAGELASLDTATDHRLAASAEAIPPGLLEQYQLGFTTLDEMAKALRVQPHLLSATLRLQGIDTSMRTRKRERFARQVETSRQLPPGSAYRTVARLYQEGNHVACQKNAWVVIMPKSGNPP